MSKEQDISLKKGDKVQVQTPGGGGFGNPKARKKELILKDILEEKITHYDALKIYGKKVIWIFQFIDVLNDWPSNSFRKHFW